MISNRVIKCPISLIFKETESFGFELVSILLIKYCSRKKYYTVVAQKRAQPPWAGFNRIFWWKLWVVSMRWWNFFAQKVFIISFGQIGLIFLLCFFYLYTGKYKTGLLLSYFSIFYWGFVSNRGHWLELFGDNGTGLVLYFFSAAAIAMMGVISIFQEHQWNTFVKSTYSCVQL